MTTPMVEREQENRKRATLARNERVRRVHDANVTATPGQLGEILALHAPVWEGHEWVGRGPKCDGCEFDGFEPERPAWPCETYRIASRHVVGPELPDPCVWCEHRRSQHSPGGCHAGDCRCSMPHGGS